jgi:hypothetical protein
VAISNLVGRCPRGHRLRRLHRVSTQKAPVGTHRLTQRSKVWDTHTGETIHTLQHSHIVRAVAFPPQARPQMLATGGMEKKLRIFDLSLSSGSPPSSNGGAVAAGVTGSLASSLASSLAGSLAGSAAGSAAGTAVPPRVGTPNGGTPPPALPASVATAAGGSGRATPTAGGSGRATPTPAPPSAGGGGGGGEGTGAPFHELGAGAHGGAIRSIVWAPRDANVLATACEDRALRWWDLRARRAVAEVVLDGAVGTCELDRGGADAGGAILSVAAGNAVYFFDAERPGALVKKVVTPYQIASVACNAAARRFITGSPGDTWVRVWDLDEEKEVGKSGARRGIRRLMGHRGWEGASWADLGVQVFAGWEAVRDGERGRDDQVVEVHERTVRPVEMSVGRMITRDGLVRVVRDADISGGMSSICQWRYRNSISKQNLAIGKTTVCKRSLQTPR